jgi:drug/metabolite transporter (DMT)-like permease
MDNSNSDNKFTLTNIGVWVLIAGVLIMSVYLILAGEEDIESTLMIIVWISLGISGLGIILIVIGRLKDKHENSNTKNGLYMHDVNPNNKDKKIK